ncbi:MAG: undecaprenyl-diphosphate phosphatase [Acidobacteria bacterium]|nr:undecaprenyl-diphosphate phosphatase [Acidobacteriota bacterium]
MPLYQAVILALVQALTEFLPVSSTAHLILVGWLFGWQDPGIAFDVALHAGTLLAVGIYFFRTWVELTLNGLGIHYPSAAPAEQIAHNRRMFWYLVLGTVPGGLAGLLFEHRVEEHLRGPITIGISMIGVALLMWWAEVKAKHSRNLDQTELSDALSIGTAQAFAVIPGVSRSGSTIAMGLARGMTRDAAARFSFLLSTPLIAGAVVSQVPKLLKLIRGGGLDLPLSTLAVAVAVSAIAGYMVIAFFIRYLQTRTLRPFIYYRLVAGAVVLWMAYLQMGSVR